MRHVEDFHHEPQRVIACRARGAHGFRCLRTAEAVNDPAQISGCTTRGGVSVRVMRRLYRCSKKTPHEFFAEWLERIAAPASTAEGGV